jgi:hypothetical protein
MAACGQVVENEASLRRKLEDIMPRRQELLRQVPARALRCAGVVRCVAQRRGRRHVSATAGGHPGRELCGRGRRPGRARAVHARRDPHGARGPRADCARAHAHTHARALAKTHAHACACRCAQTERHTERHTDTCAERERARERAIERERERARERARASEREREREARLTQVRKALADVDADEAKLTKLLKLVRQSVSLSSRSVDYEMRFALPPMIAYFRWRLMLPPPLSHP